MKMGYALRRMKNPPKKILQFFVFEISSIWNVKNVTKKKFPSAFDEKFFGYYLDDFKK